jgi:UrcA family protein
MLKTVLTAAAISTLAVAAHAADFRTDKVEAYVSTRGVNFNDPAQVRTVHEELTRTALRVCDSRMERQLDIAAADRACAKAALDRAIAQVGQPMLTAFHQGQPIEAPKTLLAQR